MYRPLPQLLCASLFVLLPACGSDPAPAPKSGADTATSTSAAPTAAAGAEKKTDTASPTTGSVQIDDRIVKACGNLPTPKFSFDSASIVGDAATALKAVARCFTDGPLAGRKLSLVGHADERGEPDYNMSLGQDRAQGVANFLGKSGMPASKIGTMSKGEMAATGTDEEGWARDRRVEVLLAD